MDSDKMIYHEFLETYPILASLPIWKAYELLLLSCLGGNKILVCGNGGSAADSEHIVGELMKGFLLRRELPEKERQSFYAEEGGEALAQKLQRCIPAISLNSHAALMTAVGNDVDYQMVFAQQVYGYGQPGDVLIAISTSGDASNVVQAAITARVMGVKVVGITGERESRLEKHCDVCLKMPVCETYRVQEYTLPVYHALCRMLEQRLFGE